MTICFNAPHNNHIVVVGLVIVVCLSWVLFRFQYFIFLLGVIVIRLEAAGDRHGGTCHVSLETMLSQSQHLPAHTESLK